MFNTRISAASTGTILSAARFRGKLDVAITVITSLIVGFLIIPNNILDNNHGTRISTGPHAIGSSSQPSDCRPEYESAYIHAGIALVVLGCLAMVVSIVLSYFSAKSKRKMDGPDTYRG